jgi:formate hydrogenlyase subunit 3/multisubunit Na+/H+ antiporter MnhD subunit
MKVGWFKKYKQEILITVASICIISGMAIFTYLIWPMIKKWLGTDKKKTAKTSAGVRLVNFD